jgi:3',5'-cyclic AMP phosphodiesterase CpdA
MRSCRFTGTSVIVAAALFVTGAVTAAPRLADARQAARVVAIGDIHGAYDQLAALLRRAGLVDDGLRWTGGRAVLVQTGDYTDRGAQVRKVMDLLMRLEREAKSAGGQVLALLGNHEVMNVIGDWRDVSAEACAAFVTPASETHREDAWKQYERLAQARARAVTPAPAVYAQTRAAWLAAHPLGCLEYREAMGPSGTYGKWLREKGIAAHVGDSLFMHAGLNPSRPAPRAIADVNEQVRAEIRRLDTHRQRLVARKLALPTFTLQQVLDVSMTELKLASEAIAVAKVAGSEAPTLDLPLLREAQDLLNIGRWSLVEPEGALWFRGYAQWPEDTSAAQVTSFLDQLKLARIVVGHTPTADRRIASRYGGRVVLIDTGMLPIYNGNASALEITGTRLKAIYPDGEVELVTTPVKASPMLAPRGTP